MKNWFGVRACVTDAVAARLPDHGIVASGSSSLPPASVCDRPARDATGVCCSGTPDHDPVAKFQANTLTVSVFPVDVTDMTECPSAPVRGLGISFSQGAEWTALRNRCTGTMPLSGNPRPAEPSNQVRTDNTRHRRHDYKGRIAAKFCTDQIGLVPPRRPVREPDLSHKLDRISPL